MGVTRLPAPDLHRSPWEGRALRSTLLTAGAWGTAILASVPLFSVLYMLIVRGGSRLSWSALVELPPAGFEMGGGFGNAIVGTVVMVGWGALLAYPRAIVGAGSLAGSGRRSRSAESVRFGPRPVRGR